MTTTAPPRETFVYKTVGACALKVDVFGAERGAAKPAVVWVHGGGLIFGARTTPRPAFLAAMLEAGAIVVSIDHRLAPETKLPAIVEDACDAWRWVVKEGPARCGIDPLRVAMAGTSSGGYLSLMCGFRAATRPRALVSLWGFGDITTPWETEPSQHYISTIEPISRERALESVGTQPISEQNPEIDRGYFYVYCRQQGRWPIEVTGHDPHAEPRWFDAFCPARNVTTHYPPTMLVHGTADNDVPVDESRNMATRLHDAGVACELVTLDGIGHGLAGATPEVVAATERRAAAFLMQHLR